MQAQPNEEDVFDSIMSGTPEPPDPAPKPTDMEEAAEQAEQPKDTNETPPESGVSALEAEENQEVDFSTLPPLVRKRLEDAEALYQQHQQLTHDYAAVHGRLAPTQRRLAELERQLTERKAQPGPNTAAPSKADTAASVGMTLPEWENYAKDFPDEARALESRINHRMKQVRDEVDSAYRDRIAELEQNVRQFAPLAGTFKHQLEVQTLEQAHPDWRHINQTDEFKAFLNGWVETLPDELRNNESWLEDRLNDSSTAIKLLNQFKSMRSISAPRQQPVARSATARLAAAPNVRGTAPPRRIDESSLDEGELFDRLMERSR